MAAKPAQARHEDRPGIGMLAGAGSLFAFSIMNAFAKYLSDSMSVIEIAFYRNVVACIPFLAAAYLFGRRDIMVIRSKPHFIVLRAVLGTVTLTATFAAFSLMPMAETSILLFTASLFIPVLGVLILGEHVGPWRWSAVIIGFVGIAIMVNPGGATNTAGVAIALFAALMQAILSILLRHLGGHERPETITVYFFLVGTVVTGLAMPFVAVGPSIADLPNLLGIGIAGAAAQWLYSTALRYTPASIVAVLNYTSLIWSTLLGWLIWNDLPTKVVLAGAVVVIGSNLLIVWRESRLRRRAVTAVGAPPVE